MPVQAARDLAGIEEGKVNAFYGAEPDQKKAGVIAGLINDMFPDYDAASSTEYAEELGSVLSQVDTFFLAVAGIAIAVGGIGVLNTMLMSVAERRKEFGILRALGWTSDDVMKLVVQESFLLGLAGGAAGLLMAYAAVNAAAGIMPFRIAPEPGTFLAGFLISVALGVAGGIYPAWRASRLEPTEAMRP